MEHQHDIDGYMESSDVVISENAGRTEFYALLSFFIVIAITAPITVFQLTLGS